MALRLMPFAVAAAATVGLACGDDHVRKCSSSSDCVQGGVAGFCLDSPISSDRFCAYPDPECASGRRWGVLAGDDLATTCVAAGDAAPDAMTVDAPDAHPSMSTLTIRLTGSGSGTVASSPGGIACPGTCSAEFVLGSEVTLHAQPTPGSVFIGWTGACVGASLDCTFTLQSPLPEVTAHFAVPGDKRWLEQIGLAATDTAGGLAVDGSGDVIVGVTLRMSGPLGDVAVVKYDGDSGNVLWQRTFASGGDDVVAGVDVDGAGDILITGSYRADIAFDGVSLTNLGQSDVFVVKLRSTDGSVVWAKRLGGSSFDAASAVGADALGDVYVTGGFFGSADFGSVNVSASGEDAFVAKLSESDGTVLWAKKYGGSGTDEGTALVSDGTSVVVGGQFSGNVTFATGFTATAGGASRDGFIMKLASADGATAWLKTFGDATGDERVGDLAADLAANVIATGRFYGAANFGGAVLMETGTMGDAFLVKYTAGGAHVFSTRWGQAGEDVGIGVAAGPSGEIWATGLFTGSVSFGGATLSSAGSTDAFFVKLSPAGLHAFSLRAGGGLSDLGKAIATDTVGNGFGAGSFTGSADFAGTPLIGANNGQDVFVISLVP